MLTPDQQRVKELLCETIILLCKNGLHFQSEFCIDALIGITLDQQDVFLVSIKETVKHGEVFVRDRQHFVKNAQDETTNNRNRVPPSSETPSDSNKTDAVNELVPEQVLGDDVAVGTPQQISESASSLAPLDEEIALKTEEMDYETVVESRTQKESEGHGSSFVAMRTGYGAQSDCNNDELNTSGSYFEGDNVCIQGDSSLLYNDGGAVVDKRSETNLSQSVHKQVPQETLAGNLKNSTPEADKYDGKRDEGTVEKHAEDQLKLQGSDDFKWNLGEKHGNDDSDGDELVVVKVEPPSADYSEEPVSLSAAYSLKVQPGCGRKFASDATGLFGKMNDMAGYSFHNSVGAAPGHKADMSGHTAGYNQFTHSLPAGRYQVGIGMSPVSMSSESLPQGFHFQSSEKTKSVVPFMSKPYKQLDYCKMSPEKDLQTFQFPEMNSVPENETAVSADIDKYMEAQNFCMNRRARSTFTAYQLQRLENAFRCNHYVDAAARSKLAEELNLSDSIILVWFQNRRQKFKKQMRMSFS